jgi:hypothetical protein
MSNASYLDLGRISSDSAGFRKTTTLTWVGSARAGGEDMFLPIASTTITRDPYWRCTLPTTFTTPPIRVTRLGSSGGDDLSPSEDFLRCRDAWVQSITEVPSSTCDGVSQRPTNRVSPAHTRVYDLLLICLYTHDDSKDFDLPTWSVS